MPASACRDALAEAGACGAAAWWANAAPERAEGDPVAARELVAATRIRTTPSRTAHIAARSGLNPSRS
jgi:hypothetical protein